MPRILILGATSFVAGYIMDLVTDQEVIALTRGERKHLSPRTGHWVEHVVYTSENLEKFLSQYRPHAIINCIGTGSRSTLNLSPLESYTRLYQSQCEISMHLFEAIRRISAYAPRVVLFGSAAEYGVSKEEKKYTESSVAQPQTWYGLTKLFQTETALLYRREYGLDVIVLRPSNIIGVGLPLGFFLSDIIAQLKAVPRGVQAVTLLLGNIDSVRDFISVEAVAQSVAWLIQGEKKVAPVLNCSSGQGVMLRTVVEIVAIWWKERFQQEVLVKARADLPFSSSTFSVLDNTRLAALGCPFPKQSLETMIHHILLKEFSI